MEILLKEDVVGWVHFLLGSKSSCCCRSLLMAPKSLPAGGEMRGIQETRTKEPKKEKGKGVMEPCTPWSD